MIQTSLSRFLWWIINQTQSKQKKRSSSMSSTEGIRRFFHYIYSKVPRTMKTWYFVELFLIIEKRLFTLTKIFAFLNCRNVNLLHYVKSPYSLVNQKLSGIHITLLGSFKQLTLAKKNRTQMVTHSYWIDELWNCRTLIGYVLSSIVTEVCMSWIHQHGRDDSIQLPGRWFTSGSSREGAYWREGAY